MKGNAKHVSHAVGAYIYYKILQLEYLGDDKTLRDRVRDVLHQKAHGTFLWVSLVVDELKEVESWKVVLDVFPSYHWIVAVDPYRPVVMRDGEGEDLLVDLILALDSTEELDDTPYRKGYAVGILPVYDVERRGAILHLAS